MKKTVAIIGGGAAAISAATFLDKDQFEVSLYEKNNALGRKLLVAGKGGFNLSHSEPMEQLISRYSPAEFLTKALSHFDNQSLRAWLHAMGIPTYIGSSGRIYPKEGIKPIEVLDAMLKRLKQEKVNFKCQYTWQGWNDNDELIFNKTEIIKADYTIFALGGSSWSITGSDGHWLKTFKEKGCNTIPFQASNCAYSIAWADAFINKYEGSPLKNIAITCLDKIQQGEVVLTRFGLEGNAIYALSPQLRQELNLNQKATIFIDLKPSLSLDTVQEKLEQSSAKNTTDTLRTVLNLSPAQLGLIKTQVSKEAFLNSKELAKNIKKLPLEITGDDILDKAISTVGGIMLNAVDENFQLKNIERQFCIGEMLDWDAPTGGYLLQASFSMGAYVANQLNNNLKA